MKVKICGISNLQDALSAVESGADYIGLIFEPKSSRCVDMQTAKLIADTLKLRNAKVKIVGVFVNQDAEFVRSCVVDFGLDAVQLHGGQSDAFIADLGDIDAEIWRAVWVKSESDLTNALALKADVLVADSRNSTSVGGTGAICDWSLISRLSKERKTALAGGINCQNASEAIGRVRPFILDVNSGVEISPRKKDISKIKDLIIKAKTK